MSNDEDNNKYVLNPYHFVPFAGKVERKRWESYYGDPTLLKSGWIDVSILTKSPLIIPSAKYTEKELPGKDEDGNPLTHKTYNFFQLPDKRYAIPGSGIRGAIRSAYEAVTNSCLPFVMDDKEVSERTPAKAGFDRRGLLSYDVGAGAWTLWDADIFKLQVRMSDVAGGEFLWCGTAFHTADHVRFQEGMGGKIVDLAPYSTGPASWDEGWLQFNVPVNPAKPYHVRVLKKTNAIKKWPLSNEKPWETQIYHAIHTPLEDSVKLKGANLHCASDLRYALEKAAGKPGPSRPVGTVGKPDGMVPVFYKAITVGSSTTYYLSGSSIGRVRRSRRWGDVLGRDNKYGDHSACKDMLCPACALFGLASDSDNSRKGRIRFSDAVAQDNAQPEERLHTLPILATPRTSAYEFYYDKPSSKAFYWNRDYYIEYVGPATTVAGHRYFALNKATPKGRKFYWRSSRTRKDAELIDINGNRMPDQNHMNSTMQAMPAGTVFQCRIYFDGILQEQLDQMIWLLTLGENDAESQLWHSLGHAKPLGYGGVKMLVTGVTTRSVEVGDNGLLSMNVTTSKVGSRPTCKLAEDAGEPITALQMLCNSALTENCCVDYPRNTRKNESTIFNWFSNNRWFNKLHTVEDLQILPGLLAGGMPFLEADNGQKREQTADAAIIAVENARAAREERKRMEANAAVRTAQFAASLDVGASVDWHIESIHGQRADVTYGDAKGSMKLPKRAQYRIGQTVKGKVTKKSLKNFALYYEVEAIK